MSEGGWFADPTGRFGQRWYDGASWTDDVVGANGSVVADPLPQTEHPYAPPVPLARSRPMASPAASAPAWGDAAPQWGQYAPEQQPPAPGPALSGEPGWPPPSAAATRYRPGAGLIVGLAGVVCALLSLFILNWVDADKGTFLDLSKSARHLGSANYPYEAAYLYAAWAGFVLFALTVALVLLAGVPLPRTAAGNTYARIAGAIVAGGAAVLHTVTIVEVFKGPVAPEAGAWVGVAGYLTVVAGLVIGARRVRVP